MKTSVIIAVIVVGVAAIGIGLASPLFINTTIDEALPEGALIKEPMMGDEMMEKEEEMMKIESMWYSGTFVGIGDGIHDVKGNSVVIPLEDGSQILRLEDFESTNGPDLFVYLSTDEVASDYVDLGMLKANRGNQNYEIPDGADLSKYNNVLIWCKSFSVLFGSSELDEHESSDQDMSQMNPIEEQPIPCTLEWVPICGVDGKTYGNQCMLDASNVGLDYQGECAP